MVRLQDLLLVVVVNYKHRSTWDFRAMLDIFFCTRSLQTVSIQHLTKCKRKGTNGVRERETDRERVKERCSQALHLDRAYPILATLFFECWAFSSCFLPFLVDLPVHLTHIVQDEVKE